MCGIMLLEVTNAILTHESRALAWNTGHAEIFPAADPSLKACFAALPVLHHHAMLAGHSRLFLPHKRDVQPHTRCGCGCNREAAAQHTSTKHF